MAFIPQSPSEESHNGLLNFLSMRRMDARLMKATAIAVRFSKSLARRRHRLSHANVRSTTPPAWQDLEPVGRIRPLHDRDGKPRQCLRQRVTEFRPLISTVGEQLLKERIKAEHGGHDIHPTVTILDVRRMNDRVQQQSYRIDEDMPLLSLDLLAGIVTIRIDAGPPFSALFTLWLSITQAVGLTSRPICSRHSM